MERVKTTRHMGERPQMLIWWFHSLLFWLWVFLIRLMIWSRLAVQCRITIHTRRMVRVQETFSSSNSNAVLTEFSTMRCYPEPQYARCHLHVMELFHLPYDHIAGCMNIWWPILYCRTFWMYCMAYSMVQVVPIPALAGITDLRSQFPQ
jgi:hypothetical protein